MRSHRHDPAVGLPASGVGGLSQKLRKNRPRNKKKQCSKVPEVRHFLRGRKALGKPAPQGSPSGGEEGNPGLFTCVRGTLVGCALRCWREISSASSEGRGCK